MLCVYSDVHTQVHTNTTQLTNDDKCVTRAILVSEGHKRLNTWRVKEGEVDIKEKTLDHKTEGCKCVTM